MSLQRILEDINKKEITEIDFTYTFKDETKTTPAGTTKERKDEIRRVLLELVQENTFKLHLEGEYSINEKSKIRYYRMINENPEKYYKSFTISYQMKN